MILIFPILKDFVRPTELRNLFPSGFIDETPRTLVLPFPRADETRTWLKKLPTDEKLDASATDRELKSGT